MPQQKNKTLRALNAELMEAEKQFAHLQLLKRQPFFMPDARDAWYKALRGGPEFEQSPMDKIVMSIQLLYQVEEAEEKLHRLREEIAYLKGARKGAKRTRQMTGKKVSRERMRLYKEMTAMRREEKKRGRKTSFSELARRLAERYWTRTSDEVDLRTERGRANFVRAYRKAAKRELL